MISLIIPAQRFAESKLSSLSLETEPSLDKTTQQESLSPYVPPWSSLFSSLNCAAILGVFLGIRNNGI
jgi:hypothetical protein